MGTVFSLPDDWMAHVDTLDPSDMGLSEFEFEMANVIKAYIARDGENSVANRAVQVFLQYVFNGRKSFLIGFENIPIGLVRNVLDEVGGERGQAFNNKLHACMIELLAYRKLNDIYGYDIVDHTRQAGDCDLIVEDRDGDRLEIEVKHKQNPEAPEEAIRNLLFGMSFLPRNSWMHGSEYKVSIKIGQPNDAVMNEIINDVKAFFGQANLLEYETETVKIRRGRDMSKSNMLHVNSRESASLIYSPTEEDLYAIIVGALIAGEGGNKQVDKLFTKYRRNPSDVYSGFIAWGLPWFWEDEEPYEMEANIKTAFSRAIIEKYGGLPFDLYIWANGFVIDKMLLLKRDL